MLGWARPARMAANSSRAASTDLSILPSASWRMSSITNAPLSCSVRVVGRWSAGADERANLLTLHSAQDVPLLLHPEHDHGQLVLAAEGERRLVHDPQVAGDRLVVGEGVELRRGRVEVGVGAVDPVDPALGDEYDVAPGLE